MRTDLINIKRRAIPPCHRDTAIDRARHFDEIRAWKLFFLFAAVFALAFGAERLLVPHVVPIGLGDEPQPPWSVEIAFVLRAIELMSAAVAIISLVLMLLAWARQLMQRRAH